MDQTEWPSVSNNTSWLTRPHHCMVSDRPWSKHIPAYCVQHIRRTTFCVCVSVHLWSEIWIESQLWYPWPVMLFSLLSSDRNSIRSCTDKCTDRLMHSCTLWCVTNSPWRSTILLWCVVYTGVQVVLVWWKECYRLFWVILEYISCIN